MPEAKAVGRRQLMNCLRRHGWTFKRQGNRWDIWKKKGSTDRIAIPRSRFIDSRVAITILGQAGLSPQQIEEFLRGVDLV